MIAAQAHTRLSGYEGLLKPLTSGDVSLSYFQYLLAQYYPPVNLYYHERHYSDATKTNAEHAVH
jgi:hypothetical protein